MDYFCLDNHPQEGELKDRNGDAMKFVYQSSNQDGNSSSVAGEEI